VPTAPGDQVLSGSLVVARTGRIRATSVGQSAYAPGVPGAAFSLIRAELQQGTSRILPMVTWIAPRAGEWQGTGKGCRAYPQSLRPANGPGFR
jgi:hypothetical protein